MPHTPTADATPRELAYRAGDGIEVSLVWSAVEDTLRVVVFDSHSGELFEVEAARDNALDVFYHPYAHGATRAAA